MSLEGQPRPIERRETQPLKGKVAVITGTSRGIGAEIAKSLAEAGVNIMGIHRDPNKDKRQEKISEFAKIQGTNFLSATGDITDEEDRDNLLSGALTLATEVRLNAQEKSDYSKPSQIDFLVLNAAGGLEKDMPQDWAEKINIEAQLELVKKFLPHMSPGGKIIYLTSLWAHRYGEEDMEMLHGYEPVASTKNIAEKELRTLMPQMQEKGVSLGIVVGHVIKGTAAHTLFNFYFKEEMTAVEKTAEGGKFPEAKDVGIALRDMLINGFESGHTVYVGGKDLPKKEKSTEPEKLTFNREEIARDLLSMYGPNKLYTDSFTVVEKGKKGTSKFTVRPEDCDGHFSKDFDDGTIQLCRYPRLKPWHFIHLSKSASADFVLNPVFLANEHRL